MTWRARAFLLSCGIGALSPACSLLTQADGCEVDEHCRDGYRCQSGACVAADDDHDGGAKDEEDAGGLPPDAGAPKSDSGTGPNDAGAPPPDAGPPPPDAGTPPFPADLDPLDGGPPAPGVDAGVMLLHDGRADSGPRPDGGPVDDGPLADGPLDDGPLDDGRADGGPPLVSDSAVDAGVDEDGRPLE